MNEMFLRYCLCHCVVLDRIVEIDQEISETLPVQFSHVQPQQLSFGGVEKIFKGEYMVQVFPTADSSQNSHCYGQVFLQILLILGISLVNIEGFVRIAGLLDPICPSVYSLKKFQQLKRGVCLSAGVQQNIDLKKAPFRAIPLPNIIRSKMYNTNLLANMEEILINPMSLVGMTIYHSKNIPTNYGLSYGLLYALQQELSYTITLTAPLGTNQTKASELVSLMIEYETLRLRKGQNNMNFYQEFILIGWYVMGAEKNIDRKTNAELSKAFEERGAIYSLSYLLAGDSDTGEPQVFKLSQPIKFKFQIDPLQKYCAEALSMQDSKKESAISKTLNKELHLIGIYNQKLEKLSSLLVKTKSEQKKRQIMQILQVYDRIQFNNRSLKEKTVEAINYSVLTGMILTHSNEK